MPLILILLLAVFQCSITNYLIMNPDYYQLGPYTWESSEFKVFLSTEETTGRATINMLFATRRELERTASKLPEVFSTVIWVEPPPSRFTAVTQPCEIR